jgi:hypothetical protein
MQTNMYRVVSTHKFGQGDTQSKGVGVGTLAWPGWKHPNIAVKWTGTTRNKLVQKMLCKMCISVLP